jgi:hypothetical protein
VGFEDFWCATAADRDHLADRHGQVSSEVPLFRLSPPAREVVAGTVAQGQCETSGYLD